MSRRTRCLITAPRPSHGPLPWPAQPKSTQIMDSRCFSVMAGAGGGDGAGSSGAGGGTGGGDATGSNGAG
eukprot:6692165-Prymnesium_polylepis.1